MVNGNDILVLEEQGYTEEDLRQRDDQVFNQFKEDQLMNLKSS